MTKNKSNFIKQLREKCQTYDVGSSMDHTPLEVILKDIKNDNITQRSIHITGYNGESFEIDLTNKDIGISIVRPDNYTIHPQRKDDRVTLITHAGNFNLMKQYFDGLINCQDAHKISALKKVSFMVNGEILSKMQDVRCLFNIFSGETVAIRFEPYVEMREGGKHGYKN